MPIHLPFSSLVYVYGVYSYVFISLRDRSGSWNHLIELNITDKKNTLKGTKKVINLMSELENMTIIEPGSAVATVAKPSSAITFPVEGRETYFYRMQVYDLRWQGQNDKI